MNKKIKYLFLLILSIFINSNLVKADINDHIIDFNKKGSVSITLNESNSNKPINKAEITIYKIANINTIDNKLIYEYVENIKNCKVDLSNLSNIKLDELEKCLQNNDVLKEIKLTNELGNVKFANLDLGLYLINQTNKIDGYSKIAPFLVTLPTEENNEWTYDINAIPKTDIISLINIIVEKKWDNTINNIPKEVTIQLLKDNQVIDTIKLNDKNNWTYTWFDFEISDNYSVKEINIPKGYTDTYRQEGNKFIVTNTKTLVQTGTYSFIVPILTLIGLLFIVIGYLLNKRYHHE